MNVTKASRYHRLRRRAELAGLLATGAALLALALSPGAVALRDAALSVVAFLPAAWATPAAAGVVSAVMAVVIVVAGLPAGYYEGHVLEHRYGLSTLPLQRWLADQVKGAGLAVILAVVAGAGVYGAMALSTRWWWLLSAGFLTVCLVVLVTVAPVLVMPLFYRFEPLERPGLTARLVALAERAGAEVVGVFTWCVSGHTRKANAALAGLGRTRRILLSDTLLADFSDDEIEVVLAHELAHHVHQDVWRGLLVQAALTVAGFGIADVILRRLAEPLGFGGVGDPAGLPLLALAAGGLSLAATPMVNALSRAHERRADRYAVEITRNPTAFASAMRRLAQQNLAEEDPSAAVQWWFHSHPPIRERIAAVESFYLALTTSVPRMSRHRSSADRLQ